MKATHLITGATGLVGRRLAAQLTRVRALVRDVDRAGDALGEDVELVPWEGAGTPVPLEALDGVETVFHLAGEPIADRRWTPEHKRRVRDSRVESTRDLVTALAAQESPPSTLICASAVGIYGDRGDERLSESAAPGSSFLSEVCVAWEREAARATELGVRVVTARFGMVLAPARGALERMVPLFRLGLGGRMGDGRQWMPWIHERDVTSLLIHARDHLALTGPLNVVSPGLATNAQFTESLGRALRRPTLLTVPRFALGVALGEMKTLVLSSQRVIPSKAQETAFRFEFEKLETALEDCVRA